MAQQQVERHFGRTWKQQTEKIPKSTFIRRSDDESRSPIPWIHREQCFSELPTLYRKEAKKPDKVAWHETYIQQLRKTSLFIDINANSTK